jgi:hypothetical protein
MELLGLLGLLGQRERQRQLERQEQWRPVLEQQRVEQEPP